MSAMKDAIVNICNAASAAQKALNEHRMSCLECATLSHVLKYETWDDCEIGKVLRYMTDSTERSFCGLVLKAYALTYPPEGHKTNPADIWQETVVSGALALPPMTPTNGAVHA